jgi:UDP:flavonoid glycosyltransferase YjiC (YdhE family)
MDRIGVLHVVLPMWVDLYDYATRVEWLGIGVWGNKASAPNWTAEELSDAFLKVLGNDTEAISMRERAKELGELFQSKPGSVCAAEELVKLAKLTAE